MIIKALNNHKIFFFITCIYTFSFISCNNNKSESKKITETKNIEKVVSAENNIETDEKTTYEEQLKSDSMNIELRLKLASIYYAERDFNRAIQNYLKVYEIDSTNLTALISLGNLYYDYDYNKEAIEFYQKALIIQPGNLNVKCDMGTCYGRMGEIDEAIRIYKENIETNFNHAQSHYNLAVFLEKKGELEEAQKEMIIFNGLQKQ